MASIVSDLNDKFDSTETLDSSLLHLIYNLSSTAFDAENTTLDSIISLSGGQLTVATLSQYIVQGLLDLLVVSLTGSPTSLSALVILEAYQISLDESGSPASLTRGGLTDVQSSFADCIVKATGSPFKSFSIFNYNLSSALINNSSLGSRRGRSLAASGAVAAGGSSSQGSSGFNNQAVDAYGYRILYGQYYAYLKYNIYDVWNQNKTVQRYVGEGCRNSLLSGLFIHVTQKSSSLCDPLSRFSKLSTSCSGWPLI